MMDYNDYRETTHPSLREEGRQFLRQRDCVVLSLMVLLLMVWLLFSGCSRNEAAMADQERPVAVTVTTTQIEPHARLHHVSGLATADEEASLSFKTGGIVARTNVEVGDRFKRGDILALLDTTEIAAMVTDAEQTALIASNDYERLLKLHESDVVTDQQLEAARAGKERAEAGLRRARFNLEYSVIRAPFDGTVNMKMSNRGEIVGAGQSIFRVLNTGAGAPPYVRVSAPASMTAALEVGQEVMVTIEQVKGEYSGRIVSISRSAEPGTGGFPVKVELPPLPELHPGLLVTVALPSPPKPMIALPAIALTNMDEDRGYIYLVVDGRASRWPVDIGMIQGDVVLVEPTLPDGSVVIVQGSSYVTDGHPVTIQEPGK